MRPSTLTVTEFVEARIAEDEVNIEGDWAAGDGGLHIISTPMHDRMVAQCAAMRKIVELHALEPDEVDVFCATCGTFFDHPVDWPCETIRALVSIYSNHPDFDPAWSIA
jgi:hypothetical protein